MKCPACHGVLSDINIGQLSVDVCRGGCGGIWFDNFELRKADDPNEFEGAALLGIERDETIAVDLKQRRSCPRCTGVVMMRHFFSERRQVEVDTCPNCGGIWLDAGELAAIRKEEHERQRQEQAVNAYFRKFLQTNVVRQRSRPTSK